MSARRHRRQPKTGPFDPGDAFITSLSSGEAAASVARRYRELIIKKKLHNEIGAYSNRLAGGGHGVWVGRHDGQPIEVTGWEILTRQAS